MAASSERHLTCLAGEYRARTVRMLVTGNLRCELYPCDRHGHTPLHICEESRKKAREDTTAALKCHDEIGSPITSVLSCCDVSVTLVLRSYNNYGCARIPNDLAQATSPITNTSVSLHVAIEE